MKSLHIVMELIDTIVIEKHYVNLLTVNVKCQSNYFYQDDINCRKVKQFNLFIHLLFINIC